MSESTYSEKRSTERSGSVESINFWKKKLEDEFHQYVAGNESTREQKQNGIRELAQVWTDRWLALEELAVREPGSGVFTRESANNILNNWLVSESRSGHSVGVALVDLDNFSKIAHPDGYEKMSVEQRLLAEKTADNAMLTHFKLVSKIAFEESQKPDADPLWKDLVVSRVGGDEMRILLPHLGRTVGTDDEGVKRFRGILETLRNGIEVRLAGESGLGSKLTASIGAVVTSDVLSVEEVEKGADEMMFQAKEQGRNRVELRRMVSGEPEVDIPRFNNINMEEIRNNWTVKEIDAKRKLLLPNVIDIMSPCISGSENSIVNSTLNELTENLANIFDSLEQNMLLDSLTGAYKRGSGNALAQKMMSAEFADGHDVALIVVNIDAFKRVNDEEPGGHGSGDKVLKNCTQIMSNALHSAGINENLVIRRRPGGEFVAIFGGADEDKVWEIARDIWSQGREDLAQNSNLSVLKTVTVAVGAGFIYPKDVAIPNEAVKVMERKAEDWLGQARRKKNELGEVQSGGDGVIMETRSGKKMLVSNRYDKNRKPGEQIVVEEKSDIG